MEYWNVGMMGYNEQEQIEFFPFLDTHYSILPSFHYSMHSH